VRAALLADPLIAAELGARIFAGAAPPGAQVPYARYERRSLVYDGDTHDGTVPRIAQLEIGVDWVAGRNRAGIVTGYAAALALADAARRALLRGPYPGTLGSHRVIRVAYEGARDLLLDRSPSAVVAGVSQRYEITYVEED